jgi:hypothetical protein
MAKVAKRKFASSVGPDSPQCTIAIDFGTSGTGFAFAFKQPDDEGSTTNPPIAVLELSLKFPQPKLLARSLEDRKQGKPPLPFF